jgi:hypothetical protein
MTFICVDKALEEDLMFWDSLITRLAESTSAGPADSFGTRVGDAPTQVVLIVGPGEYDRTDSPDFVTRMWSRGKKIIQKLNDSGVPSAVFVGSDRRLIYSLSRGRICSERLLSTLRTAPPGVLSVVMTSGLSEGGQVVDYDPLSVCSSLCLTGEEQGGNSMDNMIILVRKTSVAGRNIASGVREIAPDEIWEDDQSGAFSALMSEACWQKIKVTTPDKLFSGAALRPTP